MFPYLFQRLCEKALVSFNDTDQWHPPLALYGKASIALSQKISNTFLTTVASASDSAYLRTQLAKKDKRIQYLLTFIPSSSNSAHGYEIPSSVAAIATAEVPKDLEDPAEASDDSAGSLVF